jgi:hypothetical protein
MSSVRRGLVVTLALIALSGCASTGTNRASGTGNASTPAAAASVSTPAPSPSPSPSTAAPGCAAGGQWDCAQQRRFAAAAALIARRPGWLGAVVRDRESGAVWRGGATGEATWTASTIKLAIAADLLERHRAGQITLDATDRANIASALIDSDNDATTALWTRYDGSATLERFRSRYGMADLSVVPGYDVFWRNLRCSAADLYALMSYVLDRMAADARAYLVRTLCGVAANQHWGVWAAGAALHPGNKDGWAEKPDPEGMHWITHTVGFAGPDERYVVAVVYRLPPSGTLAEGVHTVSDVVATVFGAPVPAPITIPPP